MSKNPHDPATPLVEQIWRDISLYKQKHGFDPKYLIVSHNVLDKLRASREWVTYGQLMPDGTGLRIMGLTVATVYAHGEITRCEVAGNP